MKTKQIISLVVAVALFVLTGVASVMSWKDVNEYNSQEGVWHCHRVNTWL